MKSYAIARTNMLTVEMESLSKGRKSLG